MMKNRAKVIKKIEICKQMPILLSINKNYFHYSNIPKTAKGRIKSSHPCNEFAPICAAHPLSNFASSYSGESYISDYFHPQTIPPPRSAVLLTPHRSCRAREKHALPCDAPLSLYRCADSRWSGRKVWTWLFAPSAAPKGRRRCATFRRVVNC